MAAQTDYDMASPTLSSLSEPSCDGPTPFGPQLPGWMRGLLRCRKWYHYRCLITLQSRFMSAYNLSATHQADNNAHCWALTDEAPDCTHLRCPTCGHTCQPGVDTLAPPPAWCSNCDSCVSGWLPHTREPLLDVTWFRFMCLRCNRASLVGNDPHPDQCPNCLTYTDGAGGMRPVPTSIPTALHCWSPEWHATFPPSFRTLLRVILLANSRGVAPHWLPEDLLQLTLRYLAPHSLPDVFQRVQRQNPAPMLLCQTPTSSSSSRDGTDGLSSVNSSTSSSDAHTGSGPTTPPPYIGLWHW